mgnify:CR=1 FL=1
MSARLAIGAAAALAGLAALGRRGGSRAVPPVVRWRLDEPVLWIHPLDFLRLASTPADSPCLRDSSVEPLAATMREGRPFDVPSLEVSIVLDEGGVAESASEKFIMLHDGRHRCLAAWSLGIQSVPVCFILIGHRGDLIRQPPIDLVEDGRLSIWSQAYDDDEREECGFTEEELLSIQVGMESR